MDSDEPVLGALDTPVAKLGRDVQRRFGELDKWRGEADGRFVAVAREMRQLWMELNGLRETLDNIEQRARGQH